MFTFSVRARAYGLFFAAPVISFLCGTMTERPLNLLLVWMIGMISFGGFILLLNGLRVPIIRAGFSGWYVVPFFPALLSSSGFLATSGHLITSWMNGAETISRSGYIVFGVSILLLVYMWILLEQALSMMEDTTNNAA